MSRAVWLIPAVVVAVGSARAQGPQVTTTSLLPGTLGANYSATFTATGGTPPYSGWAVAPSSTPNDTLPTGLIVDAATGLVSGRITNGGSFAFLVTVQDSLGNLSPQQTVTMNITIPVTISTPLPLPGGNIGVSYSQPLTATGGSGPPYTWLVSSGSLPPGLTLGASTGVISGTPTSATGTPFSFSVTATDPVGRVSPAKNFSIPIAVSTTPVSVTLTSSANPTRYGQALTLTAAVSPASAAGKVTFYDGVSVLATSPVSAGQAVITTILLSPGSRSLTAVFYDGLPFYATAGSAALPQTVNPVAANDFRPPITFSLPSATDFGTLIGVADFNGDGKADLVTGAGVLLSNGDGTFQPLVAIGAGGIGAIGDFNGDGKTDLATGAGIVLGNGDGTFQTQNPIAYGGGAGVVVALAVADFNGDGIADLASPDGVSLGNGDGTFQNVIPLLSPGGDSVLVGDFNGDGKADLVASNVGSVFQNPGSNVFLGNGDGTFQPSYAGGLTTLAVGDFNGDGKTDLVDINGILLRSGDSIIPGPWPQGFTPVAAAAADFNGDGKLDLAIPVSPGSVEIFEGNGDGTFQAGVFWSASPSPIHLIAGDFNGDGRIDLVSSNQQFNSNPTNSTPSELTVLLGSEAAGAAPQVTTTSLLPGTLGANYSATFTATGGTPPYSGWNVASGSLPAALSLDTATGVLSGTPTAAGITTFGISVQDSLGNVSPTQSLSISIVAPPSVTSLSPATVTAGNSAITLTVNGGGFISGAIVVFNGTGLTTTFVNPAQLTAAVPAGLLATPHSVSVVVVNPGAITSNSSAFTVNPANFTGTATHLSITAPATANSGVAFTFNVTALDANNEPVPNFSASVQFASSDTSATLPAITTLNEAGSFSASLVTPGMQNITVSAVLFPSISGTSGSIIVTPVAGSLYIPVSPCRLVDTRAAAGPFGGPSLPASETRSFTIPSAPGCNIPATAQAYSLNLTVVPQGTLGYVTMWQTGQTQPIVSTLNSIDGRVKANAAIVPAGTGGAVSVFATDETDVILDISGYFTAPSDPSGEAFYPVTPCRLVDTRVGAPSTVSTGALIGGSSRTLPLLSSGCNVPGGAAAYSLNFTVIPANGTLGYLTVYPTGVDKPVVSTLNAPTGTVVANAAIVPAGIGGNIDVFATDTTDLVVDINGYFATPGTGGLSFYPVSPCRVLDSRDPSGAPPFIGAINVNVIGGGCASATAAHVYVFNATVVPPGSLGYLTLWAPGSTQPVVSTLNALDGTVTSNMAIVPATGNAISAFATDDTYLILDAAAYFGP